MATIATGALKGACMGHVISSLFLEYVQVGNVRLDMTMEETAQQVLKYLINRSILKCTQFHYIIMFKHCALNTIQFAKVISLIKHVGFHTTRVE